MNITHHEAMNVRHHRGFGHGLQPGTDRDINCPSCTREDAPARQHQHDAGCTWASCGPWGDDNSFTAEQPDTLRELRERS